MLEIKKMQFDECHLVVDLIHKLASEEGHNNLVKVDASQLQEDGFGAHPLFEAYIARIDDAIVGFTLYTYLYSGWLGRRLLYIEDLYILPEYRNQGFGKMFLHFLARTAHNQNIQLVWETERESFAKRQFFHSLGAKDRSDKVGQYLSGNALKNFVETPIHLG